MSGSLLYRFSWTVRIIMWYKCHCRGVRSIRAQELFEVQVDVLGSPSGLIVLIISLDVRQHLIEEEVRSNVFN